MLRQRHLSSTAVNSWPWQSKGSVLHTKHMHSVDWNLTFSPFVKWKCAPREGAEGRIHVDKVCRSVSRRKGDSLQEFYFYFHRVSLRHVFYISKWESRSFHDSAISAKETISLLLLVFCGVLQSLTIARAHDLLFSLAFTFSYECNIARHERL